MGLIDDEENSIEEDDVSLGRKEDDINSIVPQPVTSAAQGTRGNTWQTARLRNRVKNDWILSRPSKKNYMTIKKALLIVVAKWLYCKMEIKHF